MQTKQKSSIACRLSERGFTMLEMIFSFSIFCLFVSLVPVCLTVIAKEMSTSTHVQKLEFELFINQLSLEIQGSDYINVDGGRLYYHSHGELIIIEPYSSNLRRRVDNKGHEVVLQNVKAVEFREEGQSICIIITDVNNEVYEDRLYSFLQKVDAS